MLGLHFPWYLFSITIISWWNLSSSWSLTSIRFNGDKSRGENVKSASSVTFWCPLTDTLSAHYLQAQHNPLWLPRKLWTSCTNASQAAVSVGFRFILKSTTNTPSLNFGFTLDAEMHCSYCPFILFFQVSHYWHMGYSLDWSTSLSQG